MKALQQVTGDIVIIQDADLEYDPADYTKMLLPILNGHADVVYGSRFIGDGPHRNMFYFHSLGNKFLTSLSNLFTQINLTDMETGYKVFKKEVIKDMKLRANRFDFEPEFTAKILKSKVRLYEVPITFNPRDYSEGKKIGLRDAFEAVWALIKYRFVD